MFSYRDVGLSIFILGVLPFVLRRPEWGILLWTWIGLMNPHKMAWGFARDIPWALIVAVVTLVAIFISREPKRLPLKSPVVLQIVFVLWMTITTVLFALYPELAWEKWDKVVKIHFFIILTMMMMQTEQRIRLLVLVATVSIAFFGIKGGIYTIAKGGGGMVLGPDGGFISGNTEIALALTVTLPLMYWLRVQTSNKWLRRAAGVSMFLIAVSILGSYSRGGLLALAAMSVFLILKGRRKLLLAIAATVFFTSIFAFMRAEWHEKMQTIESYQEDTSAMGRLGAWKFAWNFTQAHPIGGGGFDTFQKEQYDRFAPEERAYDPHSIWFQVMAEQGFVGLALFMLYWVAAWRCASSVIRLCRRRPDLGWARDLAAMIQVSLVGFWVGGSFLGLAYWDYPYLLVAIVVITYVVVQRQLQGDASARSSRSIGQARYAPPISSGPAAAGRS
jgi:probable O-glycosylation ligase (exosortase A-associated)